jgi:hypothetical protein
MTLEEMRQNLNTLANKDETGNWFTPNEYNYLLEGLNLDFFKRKREEEVVRYGDMNRALYSSKF